MRRRCWFEHAWREVAFRDAIENVLRIEGTAFEECARCGRRRERVVLRPTWLEGGPLPGGAKPRSQGEATAPAGRKPAPPDEMPPPTYLTKGGGL